MQIRTVKQSDIENLSELTAALIVACGYEHRSTGITSVMTRLPNVKRAFCFREFSSEIARRENELFFKSRGFTMDRVGSNEPERIKAILGQTLEALPPDKRCIGFDISTMTRAWHGAIVDELRTRRDRTVLETLFAYAPGVFKKPPAYTVPNEFVAPVDGFASLSSPDLPVAVIVGLGYEKDGALGLQQMLDPELTVLMVPEDGEEDRYYPEVLRANREILDRTPSEWTFNYSLREPAGTFGTLASIIQGLRQSHRIVLASLGPKMFGLICFLLATNFPDVSVWRISSGVHSQPRDSTADLQRMTVLSVIWEP